ncbi:MAG TPA: hypothetical protein VGP72_25960 [Planctomycetota bacterium]|jgi:hypothetical protein
MRTLSTFAYLAAATLPLLAAEGPDELNVEVGGLRVVSHTATEEKGLQGVIWSPGTMLVLLVNSPTGGLVQFDGKNSALAKFVDDKGNDLLAKPTAQPLQAAPIGFNLFPKISTDGKHCAVEVCSPNVPAKGCSGVTLEGTITMLCASQKTEHIQKDVALKNGTKISAPNLELTLDNVGKPDVGDEPLGFTIRAFKELDELADIRFCKADGTEIKSRRTATSKMGILGNLTVEWNYNLAEKADVATIKLFLWSNLQKKRLPFKLNVNVGL